MYKYNSNDKTIVQERVAQFRGQVARRISGELSEEEFKPLRLMNGLYLQLHAYMLRVAIPYGTLSSAQLRKLAYIGRTYDKGYGHLTTRQNIQYHWPKLKDVPDILAHLAEVEMHAIQTSGNCVRNVTADQYAGAAADEVDDPRIYCEILRQWSTFHPEFSFLPRKFKIAMSGSKSDRAATRVHDIGFVIKRGDGASPTNGATPTNGASPTNGAIPTNGANQSGQIGFEVMVGGGLGRTPRIGVTIAEFLPVAELLNYTQAILRVYNRFGRRDNIYKARIKILVEALGGDEMRRQVEAEWRLIQKQGDLRLPAEQVERIKAYFSPPPFVAADDKGYLEATHTNPDFSRWCRHNLAPHRQNGYAIVNIPLKAAGAVPGDISATQMELVAELAQKYSFDEIRVTHEQNLVLPHVRKAELFGIWQVLEANGLATPVLGMVGDIICCPGMDYCALATARSIPVAQQIARKFQDLEKQYELGELKIKISGCINACGHHHVGHIGILGVDRRGEEYYQITLGGDGTQTASVGKIIGPAFPADKICWAIEELVKTYVAERQRGERFLDTWRRIGNDAFKQRLYAA